MECRYQPPVPEYWEGRPSPDRAYIHENIRLLDLSKEGLPPAGTSTPAIIGYACDEGVRRNLGRPGARTGPEALRRALGKMPLLSGGPAALPDAGDLVCAESGMEATQEAFASHIQSLVAGGYIPLAIGGGHDIAFGHYLGVRRALGNEARLGILNFDAHFDLRQPSPLPHSGSPFLQIAHACAETGSDFRYACMGVRRDANPQELWERAKELGTFVVPGEKMGLPDQEDVLSGLGTFLETLDALYLTIDLDGFSSAYAPGVSAASPMGFTPESFLPLLQVILESVILISMDIAELNPRLDRDGQTAVLAASLIHRILHHPGLF